MTSDTEKMLAEYPLAWSEHNMNKVLSFFNEDCIYEDITLGVVNRGKQALMKFANEMFTTQPDFHLEYTRYFANDTQGMAEWTVTHTRKGEFYGVDVTGKKVRLTGVTLFEFENGKISRNSDYWDLTPLLLQLGVLTDELRKCK